MPQVNTLAIDIAASNDYSSAQSGKSTSKNDSSKDFSQVIDEHYQAQQSGKKSESRGNNSKTSTDSNADKTTAPSKNEASNTQIKDKSSDASEDKKVSEENDTEQVTSTNPIAKETPDSDKTRSTDGNEPSKNETVAQAEVGASADDSKTSAEQLIALLSASGKILSNEGKNQESVNKDNQSQTEEKHQTKTDVDALLRQVLSGNDKKQNSEDSVTDKSRDVDAGQSKASIDNRIGNKETKAEAEVKSSGKSEQDSNALADEKPKDSTKDKVLEVETKGQSSGVNKDDVSDKNTVKSTESADKINTPSTSEHSTSEAESLLKAMSNTSAESEAEVVQGKSLLSAEQEKVSAMNKGNENSDKTDSASEKPVKTSSNKVNSQTTNVENIAKENSEVAESVTSNKVASAGISVSGEKQTQETNQNHSRASNQSAQKNIEQQTLNTGDSSEEKSSNQQNKNTSESLVSPEKLAANEAQMKEKPSSELFDKKLTNTGVETTISRDIHQSNEARKSAASAQEMITQLASETAQSTTQSATNAKLATSIQNEALSVYRKDFAGAVKDKVMVMMNQKLQQIEIRLDPQELGNVNVKINLQNEQAVVSFTVQNQQAKEALDQNLGRLKEMLAESGVDVGDANVEQQSKQSDDEQLGENGHSRGANDNNEDLSELSDTQTINLVKGSSTGVDYYA